MTDFDDVFTDAPASPRASSQGGGRRPVAGPPRPTRTPPPTRWNRRVLAAIGVLIVLLAVVAAAIVATDDGTDQPAASSRPRSTTSTKVKGATTDAPAATSTTTTAPRSAKPIWPPVVQGRPQPFGAERTPPAEIPAGAKPGVYVWTDFSGWHVWVVNGEGVSGLDGAVVSDDEIERAEPATEGEGSIETINNVIQFELPADVPIAGLDFNPGFYAKQLRFKLDGPDGPYEPAQILTGGFSVPTTSSPLILQKARY